MDSREVRPRQQPPNRASAGRNQSSGSSQSAQPVSKANIHQDKGAIQKAAGRLSVPTYIESGTTHEAHGRKSSPTCPRSISGECSSHCTVVPSLQPAYSEQSAGIITIQQCNRLCERGLYASAIKLANQLRASDGASADLLGFLAETYITQGYFNRARDILRSYPTKMAITPDSAWARNMLSCFVEALISARFTDQVEEARKIHANAEKYLQLNATMKNAIVIKVYYYKLLALGPVFGISTYENFLESMKTEICLLSDLLVQSQSFEYALKVIGHLQDGHEKRNSLQRLLQCKNLPALAKAKAQAKLATVLQSPEQYKERKKLRASAYPVLAGEHAHGRLDIDFDCWYERIMKPSANDEDHNYDIEALIVLYRYLDFPSGLKSTYYKCLAVARRLNHPDDSFKAEQVLKDLSKKTGSDLLWWISHVNQVAHVYLKTGNDDLVRQTMEIAFSHLQQYDLPYLQGVAAHTLSEINLQRGDVQKAEHWTSECLKASKGLSLGAISRGRLQDLKTKALQVSQYPGRNYDTIQLSCDEYVKQDLEDRMPVEAIGKLEVLIFLFQSDSTLPPQRQRSCMMALLERIKNILDTTQGPDHEILKADYFQKKANILISVGEGRCDFDMEMKAIGLLKDAIDAYRVGYEGKLTFPLIATRQLLGLVWYGCYQKLCRMNVVHLNVETSRNALKLAENDFAACSEGWEMLGLTMRLTDARFLKAAVQNDCRRHCWSTNQDVLESLLAAERGYDDRRTEIAISSGLSAIQDKRSLAGNKNAREIYRIAFQLCIHMEDNDAAWQWVQKAKARSLSDTLALGCLIPEALRKKIGADAEAQKLYENDIRLTQLIAASPNQELFGLRLKQRRLRKEMTTHPALKELADLRQGTSITAQELCGTSSSFYSILRDYRLVFVDWFVKDADVYILVLQSGKSPIINIVPNITVCDINSWLDENLYSANHTGGFLRRAEGQEDQALRKLDPLIELLGNLTTEEHTLVLSPTKLLEAIPLHALRLPGSEIPLIQRNPIVYCSSQTTFYQCCERAASKQTTEKAKSIFMAVYEDTGRYQFAKREQKQIYEFCERLATDMRGKPLYKEPISRHTVAKEWPKADHIYFHGHCDTPKDITNQALVLSRGAATAEPAPRGSNDQKPNMDPDLATVRQIFDIRLRAPHISLMACGSASQKLEPGDEPLGLVTALLCAGAASVTGTMWPIASRTAREFAAHFYEEVRNMKAGKTRPTNTSDRTSRSRGSRNGRSGGGGGGADTVVNLAIALQRTVVWMKDEADDMWMPYHWAGFVLNGACFAKNI